MKINTEDLGRQIEQYCWRYQKNSTNVGEFKKYRTFKQISIRFKIKYHHINRVLSANDNLELLTSVPCGFSSFPATRRGEYRVECLTDPKKKYD